MTIAGKRNKGHYEHEVIQLSHEILFTEETTAWLFRLERKSIKNSPKRSDT